MALPPGAGCRCLGPGLPWGNCDGLGGSAAESQATSLTRHLFSTVSEAIMAASQVAPDTVALGWSWCTWLMCAVGGTADTPEGAGADGRVRVELNLA